MAGYPRRNRFWDENITKEAVEELGLRWEKIRSKEHYMYLCPNCATKMAMAGFRPVAKYYHQSDWCEMCDRTEKNPANGEGVFHLYLQTGKKEWEKLSEDPFFYYNEWITRVGGV